MEKSILLIDDGKEQKQVLKNIKTYLKTTESINVITKFIDPNAREYWDESKDPNIDNLILGIQKELHSIKPNLVVVDHFYGSNKNFKGLDVIVKLRKISKFKNCKIFLISGKRTNVIKEIFDNEANDSIKVNKLAQIIGLKIDHFLDKTFKDEAINILKNTDLNDLLPTKLRSYEGENSTINTFSPKYKNLSFEELAEKIENSTPDVPNILDEMFELTLSHYLNINENLQ